MPTVQIPKKKHKLLSGMFWVGSQMVTSKWQLDEGKEKQELENLSFQKVVTS